VANAIGKPVDQLPLTPPRVLRLLKGADKKLDLAHISRDWKSNILG
jgi:hypothetical protein